MEMLAFGTQSLLKKAFIYILFSTEIKANQMEVLHFTGYFTRFSGHEIIIIPTATTINEFHAFVDVGFIVISFHVCETTSSLCGLTTHI